MTSAYISELAPSNRFLVGGSAVLDLVMRLPEDFISPVLSITGGLFGPEWLAIVSTWLLFSTVLFTFTPSIFTHLDILPSDATGFRLLFTAGTISLAIALQDLDATGPMLPAIIVGTFLVGAMLLRYLARSHGWRLTTAEGQAVELLEFFTPGEDAREEIRSDLAYEGWLGRVGLTSYLLALMLILGMPAILAAVVIQVLIYAFPIPDLLFLGWALSARLLPRLDFGPNRGHVLSLEFDIEAYLIDIIENATRSVQGMVATMYALLGAVLSAGYLFIAVQFGPGLLEAFSIGVAALPNAISLERIRILWKLLGVFVLLVLAGGYGLWGWIRELARLPHYLDRWEDRQTTHSDPPARVSGFISIPSASFLLASGVVASEQVGLNGVLAFIWPLVIPATVLGIRHTNRRSPQNVRFEYWWITAGLIIYTVTLWSGASLTKLLQVWGSAGTLVSVASLPIAVILLCLLMAILPITSSYAEAYEDHRKYTFAAVLFILSLLALAASALLQAPYNGQALMLAIVGGFFTVVLTIVKYYNL